MLYAIILFMENDQKDVTTEKMNTYEMGYLLSGKMPLEDAETYVGTIESIIRNDASGIISKRAHPQKKKLAYPVKKERYGYFGTINFEMPRKHIKTINQKLRLEQNLLRHIVLTVDLKKILRVTPARSRRRPILQKEAPKPSERKEVKMKELEKRLEEIIEG